MKILITGAGGMLGSDLAYVFREFPVVGIGRRLTPYAREPYRIQNLCDAKGVIEVVKAEKPDIIFHAAAMTNVDGCERDPKQAWRDNVEATKNVVEAANQVKAQLIFFSTDYVFNGVKKGAYSEEDEPHPLSEYGKTKLAAENYIRQKAEKFVIFRISWLYGLHGNSFPRTILERVKQTKEFEIVNDQIGSPTYTHDVAKAFLKLFQGESDILLKHNQQIFNLANEGTVNWADFADFILNRAGYTSFSIKRITSNQLKRDAKRPLNSVLSTQKATEQLGIRLRPWQEAITDFVTAYQKELM